MSDELPPATPDSGAPKRGRGYHVGAFLGGCLITCALAAVLGITVFARASSISGCGLLQLIYVVPAVFFLFRTGRRSWALGSLFGGALVLLFASLCAPLMKGGFH